MSAHVSADRQLLYAAGEMTQLDRESVEEHLESCDACRAEADLVKRNTVFLRGRLSALTSLVQPDMTFLQSTTGQIPKIAESEAPRRERKRLPVFIPAAAVVLTLGAVGYLLLSAQDGEPGDTPNSEDATTRVTRTETDRDDPTGPESTGPGPKEPERAPEPEVVPKRPTGTFQPPPVRGGLSILLPRLLTTPSQSTLEAVWKALEEKPGGAERILRSLEGTTGDERKRPVLTLALVGIRGTREGRDVLVALLTSDGSPAVRRAAGAALGHVEGGPGSPLQVVHGLSVRTGPITDEETRSTILAAAETEREPEVIGALVRLLAPSQGLEPSILPRLVELARSENLIVRSSALEAIVDGIRAGRVEDPAPFMDLIRRPELPVKSRASIVNAFGPALGDRAADLLLEIFRESEEIEIRVAAVSALSDASSKDPKALAEVVSILRSGEVPRIRAAALAGVARRRDAESTAILKELASGDPDEGIRRAAKDALKVRDAK